MMPFLDLVTEGRSVRTGFGIKPANSWAVEIEDRPKSSQKGKVRAEGK